MSRDLQAFAASFGAGLQQAANIWVHNRNRAEDRAEKAKDRAATWEWRKHQDARQQRIMERQERESQSLIDYRNRKGVKGAAAAGPSPAYGAVDSILTNAGAPPSPTTQPTVIVQGGDGSDAAMAPTNWGNTGGFGDDDVMAQRRGGPVKAFNDGGPITAGTNGPGQGFGIRAAPPTGYVAGSRKGGPVQAFVAGGPPEPDETLIATAPPQGVANGPASAIQPGVPTGASPVLGDGSGPAGTGAPPAGVPPATVGMGGERRTAAYDPVKDAADPANVHAVDRWGRARAQDNAFAPAHAAGLNFIERLFHLDKPSSNSARGYQALIDGKAAPDIGTMQQVFNAVDPENRLPMDQKVKRALEMAYATADMQGDPNKGAKMAGEIMMFANEQAKTHGKAALDLAQKGDMQGATNHLLAGYNWLPNGWTANISKDGKSFELDDGKGKIDKTIPLNKESVGMLSLAMGSGELGWIAMRSVPNAPASGGGAPPPANGGSPPAGGLPPQVSGSASTGGAAPAQSAAPTFEQRYPVAQPPAAVQPAPPLPQRAVPPPPGAVPPPPGAIQPAPPLPVESAPAAPSPVRPTAGDGVSDDRTIRIRRDDTGAQTRSIAKQREQMQTQFDATMAEINKSRGKVPKGRETQDIEKRIGEYRKGHEAKMKELDDRRKGLRDEQKRADEKEAKELEPKMPTSTQEDDNWSTKVKDHITKLPADDPLVQASPLRYSKDDPSRQPMVALIKLVKAHNHELELPQAAQLVLQATSYVGDDDKAKAASGNGKIGKEGERFKVLPGKNVRGDHVIEIGGEQLHITKSMLAQLRKLKDQNFADAAKPKEKGTLEKLKGRDWGAFMPDTLKGTIEDIKGLDLPGRAQAITPTVPPQTYEDVQRARRQAPPRVIE